MATHEGDHGVWHGRHSVRSKKPGQKIGSQNRGGVEEKDEKDSNEQVSLLGSKDEGRRNRNKNQPRCLKDGGRQPVTDKLQIGVPSQGAVQVEGPNGQDQ